MTTPTLKTFVMATIQPLIVSLKTFYDNTVKNMLKHVVAQDVSITETQSSLAATKINVVELASWVNECKARMIVIEEKLYTSEQVKVVEARLRQYEMMVGSLFDWIYRHYDPEYLKDLPSSNPDDYGDKTEQGDPENPEQPTE